MAFRRAGAGKILFGSDGPWLHPKVELEKVFALTASKNDLQKMLATNFLKLTAKARSSTNKKPVHKKPSFKKTEDVMSNEYHDPWLVKA